MRSFSILGLAAVVLVSAAAAGAQDVDAGLDPSAWYARAEAAEHAGRPAEALADWHALVATAPSSRLASRARARIGWIEARGEGDYVPLASMMAFLDAPPATRDVERVSQFATEVASMPAGRVRAESRVAIGGEWARLGRTEEALAAWQLALTDADLNDGERTMIRESMAHARMDAGDLRGALEELDEADLGASSYHRVAERRLRAQTWVPIAWAVIAAFVALVLALVLRSGRTKAVVSSLVRAPLRLVVAAVMGFGPACIVLWWGDDSLEAFEAFAPCSFGILVLSYLAGEATESRGARAAVGALALAAAIGSAYVVVVAYADALPFA